MGKEKTKPGKIIPGTYHWIRTLSSPLEWQPARNDHRGWHTTYGIVSDIAEVGSYITKPGELKKKKLWAPTDQNNGGGLSVDYHNISATRRDATLGGSGPPIPVIVSYPRWLMREMAAKLRKK